MLAEDTMLDAEIVEVVQWSATTASGEDRIVGSHEGGGQDSEEAEVTGSGSRGVGYVASVDTEILQNCHQSRTGESYGVSRTKASRNGAGTGERMRETEGGGC